MPSLTDDQTVDQQHDPGGHRRRAGTGKIRWIAVAAVLLSALWSPAPSLGQQDRAIEAAADLDDHFEALARLVEAEERAEAEAEAEAGADDPVDECEPAAAEDEAGEPDAGEGEDAPAEEGEDAEEPVEEEDDAGDETPVEEAECEEVSKPIAPPAGAAAKLTVSRAAPLSIIASGRVRRRGIRSVRLTVYRSDRGGRWRKVATRTAPVTAGRFKLRVARKRRNSEYRVVVSHPRSARAKKGKSRRGLSNPAGGRGSGAGARSALAEARLLDVPSPGPLPGGRVIAVGAPAERALVRALQARLTVSGVRTPITGSFDPRTRASVIRFQTAHGLLVDGIVGRQTASALSVYR